MNASHLIFLYVVEESSISKAAQRAFVTQQCASDHIRRLEEQYGAKLFYRKPRFTLTPAGQVLLQTIKQMNLLEKNLDEKLSEIKHGTAGHLYFGITAPRAHVILPRVLRKYNALLPNMKVSVISSDTRSLEQCFLKGDIDLFVGVNVREIPNSHSTELARDQLFFLATADFLEFHGKSSEKIVRAIRDDAFFSSIEGLPIAQNTNDSAFSELVSQYLTYENIEIYSPFHTNDYDMQLELCIANACAAFCPTLMLDKVLAYNRTHEKQILIFPLSQIPQHLRFELIAWNNVHDVAYKTAFIKLLKEEVEYCYKSIQAQCESSHSIRTLPT